MQANRFWIGFTDQFPPGQFGRYLAVGLWNTLFGYSSYALLTLVLTGRIPHAYVLASIIANLLNITIAYLGYKFFIFKTHGNYVKEWLRCLLVYSGSIVIYVSLLPVVVAILGYLFLLQKSAPYVAGALLMAANTLISFFGHKRFSFASKWNLR
jgi:putative flippase GtrA